MIQGLNILINVERVSDGVDDEVGGAVTTTSIIATNVKSRISSLKPDEQLRAAGIEITKLYNMHVVPVTQDIRQNDYIVPVTGIHVGKTFRVLGVQVDSILPNDPRAHLSARLQRIERARSIQ